MPHKGENAIYKIARIISEVEKLNERLKDDAFLGKGTITVSYVDCKTPSMCAVPDKAYIHLDRRLTRGESKELALRQIREITKKVDVRAEVKIPQYERPTYTGFSYPTASYFPTWCEPEDAPQVEAAVETYRRLFKKKTQVGRWTFSTNGVSIAGMFGIPCVGFGPAPESVAHTVNDSVPIDHLVKCAAFYATYPSTYVAANPKPCRG
jgi:putative selenium metabolism hydrolase